MDIINMLLAIIIIVIAFSNVGEEVNAVTTSFPSESLGTTITARSETDIISDREDALPDISILCPADMRVPNDPGTNYAMVTWTEPQILGYDGEPFYIIESSHYSGTRFHLGTAPVTFTVFTTPQYTRLSECQFDVTVVDTEKPTIECPESKEYLVAPGEQHRVSWNEPVYSDNSGLFSKSQTHYPDDYFSVGDTVVTYRVRDPFGNFVICRFNVTVTEVSVTCPGDIILPVDGQIGRAKVTWGQPVVSVEEDMVSTASSHTPGDEFIVGNTTVTYDVRDPGENKRLASCSFSIELVAVNISCPANMLVSTNIRVNYTNVSWIEPDIMASSANAQDLVRINSTHRSSMIFYIGTATVKYFVLGMEGGIVGNCNFNVSVQDLEKPSIVCPSNIHMLVGTNSWPGVKWDEIKSWDNSGYVITTSTHKPGAILPAGSTKVIYTATDQNGNNNTCSFNVSLTEAQILCPLDVHEAINGDLSSTLVSWQTPDVNVGGNVRVVGSISPNTEFIVGSTEVTYIVISGDDNINLTSCSFTVHIYGVTLICPDDIHTATDPGSAFATLTWNAPEVNGGGDTVEVNITEEYAQTFPVGNLSVSYAAYDNDGVILTTCSFDIHVFDAEPPDLKCPEDIVENVFTGNTSIDIYWNPVTPTDNSNEAVFVSSTHKSGDIFGVGCTNVTYNVIDESGNVASCSFAVTVLVLCPAETSFITDFGEISWPSLAPGTFTESSVRCSMNSHQPIATRQCLFDHDLGARWNDLVLTNCTAETSLTTEVNEETTDVIQLAAILYDRVRQMDFVFFNELMEIIESIEEIVAASAYQPEVLLSLMSTANHIMLTNMSPPCLNKPLLSTETLREVLSLLENQTKHVVHTDDFNMYGNGVLVKKSNVNLNSDMNVLQIEADIGHLNNFSDVQVLLPVQNCFTPTAARNTNAVILSVYNMNYTNYQLDTHSLEEQSVALVSPLVSVAMATTFCLNTNQNITIRLPYSEKDREHKIMFQGKLECVSLDLKDGISSSGWSSADCAILNITDDHVTCSCQKLALYGVTMDYQCPPSHRSAQVEHLYVFGRMSCYVAIAALFISVILILAKREWTLPIRRQIVFHYYISILSLCSMVLLVGHFMNLPFGCVVVKVVLHYFILTTLIWSAVEAQYMYIISVKMGDIHSWKVIPICCFLGWLLPVAPVGLSVWLWTDTSDNKTCMLTDNVVGYFTLILPACVICLHNITVYFISSVQLLKTSRDYPLYRHISFRLLEAVCVFTLTFVIILFVNLWIAVPSLTFQFVFSVSCIAEGVIILTLSCQRVMPMPGKSRSYDLNKQRSLDGGNMNDSEGVLRARFYLAHDGTLQSTSEENHMSHDQEDSGVVENEGSINNENLADVGGAEAAAGASLTVENIEVHGLGRRKSSFGHIIDIDELDDYRQSGYSDCGSDDLCLMSSVL